MDGPRPFLNKTVLHGKISVSGSITGITVLNRELFVVPYLSSQVNVYDTNNLTLTRNITISGSSTLLAIVASPQSNCLYISDVNLKVIQLYNLSSNVISSWPVYGDSHGLSLTSTGNVLVTLREDKKIKEYKPDGTFVREIMLENSINDPWHSIQLSSDEIVVSHGHQDASLHRICIVNNSGRIKQCYGEIQGTRVGRLNHPRNLAKDKDDNILVVDSNNNRIVLLSRSLNHLGYITVPGHELRFPYALHLDELNHRLYIGEWNNNPSNVLVLGNSSIMINASM